MTDIEQLLVAPFDLATIRKIRGMSQAEVAKAVGVSRVTYNKWEAGSFGKADIVKAMKVAETLGVRIEMIKY